MTTTKAIKQGHKLADILLDLIVASMRVGLTTYCYLTHKDAEPAILNLENSQ